MEGHTQSSEPRRCTFSAICGSRWWFTVADIYLISFLVYKIISEATKYSEWEQVGCTRLFVPFLTVHCLSFIFYRLFHYLESHYRYRGFRDTLSESAEQQYNAHGRAKIMHYLKFFSFTSFVIMTFVGTSWCAYEQGCPKNLISRLNLWVMMSWVIFLFYVIMAGLGQNTVRIAEQDTEMPSSAGGRNIHLNRIQYDMLRSGLKNTNQGLSKSKISLIKKQKLILREDLESNAMLFDSESSEEFWIVCSVCLEDITVNDWYKQLPDCGHYFHAECIDRWLAVRALCPVCRESVGKEEAERKSPSCSFRTPRITMVSPRRSLSLRRSLEHWISNNGLLTQKISIDGGKIENHVHVTL